MKEKIINFLKSKPQISFLNMNLSLEVKFIILGLFYILIPIPIMTIIGLTKLIFGIFTFSIFYIYFCTKHLFSLPSLSKKRFFLSSAIIIIFVYELLTLIGYIGLLIYFCFALFLDSKTTQSDILATFLPLILFLTYLISAYLKSNPNKIIDIIKTFIFEFFQFFAVAIFYFLIIKFTPEKYDSSFLTLAIAINIILLSRTNILAKRVSTMLETLSIGYLFIQLTFISLASERLTIVKHLSLENYIVIFILMINLIGFSIVFFTTKIRAEKAKIILLIALMISFFFADNEIVL